MTKQIILFDMDDTLIYCNKFFDLVMEQFADQMEAWFHGYKLSIDEVKKKQAEIDLERVLVEGFSPDHFPQSFVDTYDYYSDLTGRHKSEAEIERLMELGASVYGHSIEPYPYMEETLRTLTAEGHELHLYTGGDPAIQMRKVKEAGLERYFAARIHITRHKKHRVFGRLDPLARLRPQPHLDDRQLAAYGHYSGAHLRYPCHLHAGGA